MDAVEETVSEADLARRLRAGDAEALAVLFDEHADRIYRHCYRLTVDRSDAEDATATTFLEVWRHRDRVVVHDGSVLPWLHGVATNVCRNLTRGRRRRQLATARLPSPEPHADHADAVADRLAAEQRPPSSTSPTPAPRPTTAVSGLSPRRPPRSWGGSPR